MKKMLWLLLACLAAFPSSAQNIYQLDSILTVKMYFSEPNWDDILDSLKQLGNDQRIVGDVVVNGVRYKESGVRYKGNSSYYNVRNGGSSKLPFNVKVDFVKDKQKLPGGYVTLKLSNVFRDPSFLREVMAYEIAGKYMPAPRANFAKVYVNDTYLGLYNCSESVDEEFLEAYFGDDKGVLIKCDPNWSGRELPQCPEGDKASLQYLGKDSICYMQLYEMKDNMGWSDLIQLTRLLKEKPDSIENLMNIDQVLWMLAYNNVLVNLDSYLGRLCHNYYLYKDTFGIFQPVVWDMNLCFGGFRYTGIGGALSNEELQSLSPFLHYKEKNPQRPLVTNLLQNDLYRKIYIDHMRVILEDNFYNGRYKERAEAIHKMLEQLVKKDTNRLYTYEDFKKNLHESVKVDNSSIIGITELMEKRVAYFKAHPLFQKAPPAISEVEHKSYNDGISVTARIDDAERAWLCYRYGPLGPFKKVSMNSNSGYSEPVASEDIWNATIDAGKGVQYYILAEGEKTAGTSPERASMEFYEVK